MKINKDSDQSHAEVGDNTSSETTCQPHTQSAGCDSKTGAVGDNTRSEAHAQDVDENTMTGAVGDNRGTGATCSQSTRQEAQKPEVNGQKADGVVKDSNSVVDQNSNRTEDN